MEVKRIEDPDNAGSFLLLCRSVARRQKELAMLSRAEERFLADMALLKERIAKGTFKNPALIERKIGILLKSHPRVARFYQLEIKEGLLAGTRNDASFEDQLDLCGNYILRTDQVLEPGQIWSLYMTLLQAEEGFACLKGSLGLRPNFHQLERRVDAHIFISVLAYHLLTWVREKLRAHGDTRD